MNDVKPSEIIILASGAALLIFSFLDWFGEGFFSVNAWDWFPLLTWPAILGVAGAIVLALEKFANVNLPAAILGFTWTQIYLVIGLIAVLITLGALIGIDGSAKVGLFISLLAAIGFLVGAVLRMNEDETTPSRGSSPPQSF